MKYLILLLCLIPIVGYTQNAVNSSNEINNGEGIHFLHGSNWQEIKNRAKVENKFIFLDCYATWCAPCKFMKQFIFSKREVGDYFNKYFISVEVQMDKTNTDNVDIKTWYNYAQQIAKQYDINSYPTYIFLSPDGIPLHRVVGATGNNVNSFLDEAYKTFIPEKQYYHLTSDYQLHLNDSNYLRNKIIIAEDKHDNRFVVTLTNYYIRAIESIYNRDNINFLLGTIYSTSDDAFKLLATCPNRIDSIIGNSSGSSKLMKVVLTESIDSLFGQSKLPYMDWKEISNKLYNKFPNFGGKILIKAKALFAENVTLGIRQDIQDDTVNAVNWAVIENKWNHKIAHFDIFQILLNEKMRYYGGREQWDSCLSTAYMLIDRYGYLLSEGALNNICWSYIFYHSNDRRVLMKAIGEMRERVHNYDFAHYESLDTYANLLYKVGKRKKAIYLENKMVSRLKTKVGSDNIEYIRIFKATIQRMTRKLPTWVDRDKNDNYI